MRRIVEKSMLGKAWVMDVSESENNESKNAGLHDGLISQILTSRGIIGEDEIRKFLNPSVKESMPDPSVLLGMDKAVQIITNAIIQNKKIAVYGDYDVDGITSTAIFIKFLRALDVNVIWYLPSREGEGYGLNNDAIENLHNQNTDLIITVDCGISSVQEIEFAHSKGIQVVVTDHHVPDSELPKADAIVNPKQIEDNSGMSYLAGVGVAFLTIVALNRELRKHDQIDKEKLDKINLLNYLDLIALGTICDMMPLVGLNRAIVSTGLKVLELRQNIGLRALMDVAKIKQPNAYSAVFAIGPRLNAAGRLDSAAPALELLLTDNVLIANDLANKLNKTNQERMDIQNAVMMDAIDIARTKRESGKCLLYLCSDDWHRGIMGIVAGRVKDKYNLPACVATRVDGIINGSGRSIPGVDLGKIIHDALAARIITEGGGHAAAAGFTLPAENEEAFCEFLENAVSLQLGGCQPVSEILVDAQMDASGANIKLANALGALGPFGQGNPEPTLVLDGGVLDYASVMGNGSHLRGAVRTSSGTKLAFVGFNMAGTAVGNFLLDDENANTKIKMLGKLKENEYNGRVSAQFVLEDLYVGQ